MFPKNKTPYVVYAPSYTYKSSGVMTLHHLVHELNEVGQRAYLYPDNLEGYACHPELNTPIVQENIGFFNYFATNDLCPIVIYPDIVKGNPLGATKVVRYLLAIAGAFGGTKIFPETDNIWGALPSIASKVLRFPISDPSIFYDGGKLREGSCFYAHKYDKIHGNPLLKVTKNSIRLEGTRDHIAEILRTSSVCYLYELSSIITEAALCGCPVVLLKTSYFSDIDPDCMMGGVVWSDGVVVKECADYRDIYREEVRGFRANLAKFIQDTQEME